MKTVLTFAIVAFLSFSAHAQQFITASQWHDYIAKQQTSSRFNAAGHNVLEFAPSKEAIVIIVNDYDSSEKNTDTWYLFLHKDSMAKEQYFVTRYCYRKRKYDASGKLERGPWSQEPSDKELTMLTGKISERLFNKTQLYSNE